MLKVPDRTAYKIRIGDFMSRIQDQREAFTGDYEVNEREAKTIRACLYGLNKNNVVYRYRTMYEVGILRVWRFRK